MSDATILLVINAIILPIVAMILKINRDQSIRIEGLETKLDDCLAWNAQSGVWQQGQAKQRSNMFDRQLDPDKTPPPNR